MDSSPVYFIHLTDTHIKAPGARPFLNLDMSAKLRNVFAAVKELSIQPVCFVISGDLTHEGDTADYQHFKTLVDEAATDFGVPVLVALGNHDHRNHFREGYLGESPSNAAYNYTTVVDGLRFIVLDSEISDEGEKVEGKLDPAQLEWLKAELTTPSWGDSQGDARAASRRDGSPVYRANGLGFRVASAVGSVPPSP